MKYDHINFKPPKSVADAASRGLDYRQKAKDKGGLTPEEASKEGVGSGVQRAVNLKNRDVISPEVIKKMVAFFSRHEKNKSIAPEHKDKPWEDKGHVSWLLWGGDAGKTWANKVRDQMDAADRKSTASKVASRYLASFMMVPKNALPVIKDHVLAIAEEGLHGGNPGQLMGAAVRDIGKVLSAHGLSNQEIHEFIATLIGQVKVAERHLQIDVDVVSYGKIVSLLNDALLNMSYDVNRGADKPLSTVYRILGRSAFLDVAESKKMLSEAITTRTLDFDPSSAQMGQILGTFSKVAKNLPPSVERYVKEHKEQGMDEGKAWAIAWSRYCVAGDTLIPTELGLQSIASLYNMAQGQKVVHSDGVIAKTSQVRVASRSGFSDATHIINTGTKSVVNVQTKHGYELTCTPDHQILVLNESNYETEWVEAKFALGRYAIIPSQGVWGQQTDLPILQYTVNSWNNVVPIKKPTKMTSSLARMLGYLVSEGSVTEEGIEFSNTNPKVVQDFVRCATDVFGQKPSVKWKDRTKEGWKTCAQVRLRTRWYKEFFQTIGLGPCTAQNKRVPHSVLNSPPKFVREFLIGFVEGDGYTGGQKHFNRIDLSTSSGILAKQLHLLLLNFGIPSSLEENSRGYYNVRIHSKPLVEMYSHRIGTAFKKIALSEERKLLRGSEFEMIPIKALYGMDSKMKSIFPGATRISLSRLLRKWDVLEECRGSSYIVDNIRSLIDSEYRFDKVTQVVPRGEVEVYDISVPKDTSFVGNGMILHNCQYKNPDSPRCKQDEYFGKSAFVGTPKIS